MCNPHSVVNGLLAIITVLMYRYMETRVIQETRSFVNRYFVPNLLLGFLSVFSRFSEVGFKFRGNPSKTRAWNTPLTLVLPASHHDASTITTPLSAL